MCNPNWSENKRALFPSESPPVRLDLATRVFMMKMQEMMSKEKDEKLPGSEAMYVRVVRCQKCCL